MGPNIEVSAALSLCVAALGVGLACKIKHILVSLIVLEAFSLTLYQLLSLTPVPGPHAVVVLLLLVVRVCDAVGGLGVIMARVRGHHSLVSSSYIA